MIKRVDQSLDKRTKVAVLPPGSEGWSYAKKMAFFDARYEYMRALVKKGVKGVVQ